MVKKIQLKWRRNENFKKNQLQKRWKSTDLSIAPNGLLTVLVSSKK